MLKQVHSYLKEQSTKWNDRESRVDNDYAIKTQIFVEKQQVFVYKVGEMGGEEMTWNAVTGVEIREGKYVVYFILDPEKEIIDSLTNAGYAHHRNLWIKEFVIEVDTFEAVKDLYEQHVWRFDPGYFY